MRVGEAYEGLSGSGADSVGGQKGAQGDAQAVGCIHFDKRRITVRSPKTAHQGKATRTIPLFSELETLLVTAFEQAEPGQVHVIARSRDAGQNLWPQAHRIIERAGLEPWPKTFQNLRSSRETELAETYPVQVVCAWIGNSPAIAAKHYQQVTEDHFKKAVQNPVQFVLNMHCQGKRAATRGRKEKMTQAVASRSPSKTFTGNGLQFLPPRGLEPLSPG